MFRHFTFPTLAASLVGTAPLLPAQEVPAPPDVPLPEGSAAGGEPLLPEVSPSAAPSQNATINLIRALVKKGILTQAEAEELILQAEEDAALARAQAEAAVAVVPAGPAPLDPLGGDVSVNYVPEVVRNSIRDEVKQELLAYAREEAWATSPAADWTHKFRPYGDFRGRAEKVFFDSGNALYDENGYPGGYFPDFSAINRGDPYDASFSNPNFAPQHNVHRDRERLLLRARAGVGILLGEGFSAGLGLTTGNSAAPATPNQTLGADGGFSKYAVWLDRAFLSYDAGPGDGEELVFTLGRFDNPFFSTETQWDRELAFDGLVARGRVRLKDHISTFFTAGALPIFNTDFDFATNNPEKFKSDDKWLYAAQVGLDWKINNDWKTKFAVAYYDFQNIEGRLSDSFIPLSAQDAGSTDATRPLYAQRGNTYRPLRRIDNSTSANDFGNLYQYQYYGLATPFRNLTFTGRLDYEKYPEMRFALVGEVTKNVAFDKSDINAVAVNNLRDSVGTFDGGDLAWNLAFQFGNPALARWGDWLGSIGYRYVESDAIVDGFTDTNFGGGGTNLKGFTVSAALALTPDVRLALRWLSSDEIAGPPLKSDTVQFDLNAKF